MHRRFALVLVLVVVSCRRALADPEPMEARSWGYAAHDGPAVWGSLDASFATCASGLEQSPVDISTSGDRGRSGGPGVAVRYRPSALTLVHNGHTVEGLYERGSHLVDGRTRWEVVQFHFHVPGEHTFDGTAGDLELHVVHRGAGGRVAVLAVAFDLGEENLQLEPVIRNIPEQGFVLVVLSHVSVDLGELLPKNMSVLRYRGSLTTPPCTEPVAWYVARERSTVGPSQLRALRRVIGGNARPTQPLHGRRIGD